MKRRKMSRSYSKKDFRRKSGTKNINMTGPRSARGGGRL